MIYEVPKSGIIILVTIYGFLSLTSTVGNIAILYVIARSKKLRGVTNMFIANLAVADILISLIVTPFSFQAALLQKWVIPTFFCNLSPFIQTLSFNVSIFTFMAISVDRFRAVIFPLKTHASDVKAKWVIIPIWLAALGLSIPTYLALRVVWKYPDDPRNYEMICDIVGVNREYFKYYTFILVTCQYLIPLIVISISYASIAYKLHHNNDVVISAPNGIVGVQNGVGIGDSAGINVSSGYRRIIENRGKCVKMMIIVVSIFAICWFPYQLYTTLSEIYPHINGYYYINLIFFAIHILAISSTCFNPFIYYIFSEHYNEEIRKTFKCFFRDRPLSGDPHIPTISRITANGQGNRRSINNQVSWIQLSSVNGNVTEETRNP